jgi:hypothetical protein
MRYILLSLACVLIQGCQQAERDPVRGAVRVSSTSTLEINEVSLDNGRLTTIVQISGRQIRVFRPSNSWGAYAYSIRITTDAKTFDISRRSGLIWTVNVPGFYDLHDWQNALNFDLLDGTWDGAEGLIALAPGQITRVEIAYLTVETRESQRLGVDIGPMKMTWRRRDT